MDTEPSPATDAASKPRRSGGRPPATDAPRTTLDRWVVERAITSQAMSDLCRAAAERLGIEEKYVPTRKSVDDMRAGRYYPSLSAAWLISEATEGAIGLAQWARDQARFPRRARQPKS